MYETAIQSCFTVVSYGAKHATYTIKICQIKAKNSEEQYEEQELNLCREFSEHALIHEAKWFIAFATCCGWRLFVKK